MKKVMFDSMLNSLSSREVWAVKRGVGSFLNLDLGERLPTAKPDGSAAEMGELHLWIYLCDWRILRDGDCVLSSLSDSTPDSRLVLDGLQGRKLEGLTTSSDGSHVEIVFDGGYLLHLSENSAEYDDEDDMLIAYFANFEPMGYRADTGFYFDQE